MKKIYIGFLGLLFLTLCAGCTKEEETRPSVDLNRVSRNIIFSSSDTLAQPSSPLNIPTAGEWNDLSHWDFWTALLQHHEWAARQSSWKMYPTEKYTVYLTDASGNRVYDAIISLEDLQGNTVAEGRTDNTGRSVLFPALSFKTPKRTTEYQVKVLYEEQLYYLGKVNSQHPLLYKKIPVVRKRYSNLDIVFAMDASQAMGLETDYLKEKLPEIIKQVKQQHTQLQIRVGGVFYQQQGNEATLHSFPFTTDVKKMEDLFSWKQTAVETPLPEMFTESLSGAINGQKWNGKAVSRIVFLMLANSSLETGKSQNKLLQLIKTAARKGIRIIPVTSTYVDVDTEFLLRTLAITSNSTAVFIAERNHTPVRPQDRTIGAYKTEYLHELITRLLIQYSRMN